ncbi:MAG: serine protease, partial [Mycobacteriaceae bacterium]|nr:serine protease [Mycobacteriaceae bacterium]
MSSENRDSVQVGNAADDSNLRPPDAPVLRARPVYRPAVDDATVQAFGRPEGHDGSFSAVDRRGEPQSGVTVRPPDPVLAEAFSRPSGSTEVLQRDPYAAEPEVTEEPGDPWRDPEAPAVAGPPAIGTPARAVLPPTEQLTAREVLFGSRVRPKA